MLLYEYYWRGIFLEGDLGETQHKFRFPSSLARPSLGHFCGQGETLHLRGFWRLGFASTCHHPSLLYGGRFYMWKISWCNLKCKNKSLFRI